MTIKKKHIVTNLRLSEISSVDRPAQVGAVSVLIKRAGEVEVTDANIRKNAAAVAGGAKPEHTVTDFEDAMQRRAEELAKDYGCTPEQALSKGMFTNRDRVLLDLAHASEVARVAAYGVEVAKRHRAA